MSVSFVVNFEEIAEEIKRVVFESISEEGLKQSVGHVIKSQGYREA